MRCVRRFLSGLFSVVLLASSLGASQSQELAKLPDVVEKVARSVVTIENKVSGKDTAAANQASAEKNAPIRGTGFVISADGYIATSVALVEDNGEITVILADAKRLPAKVVGSDQFTKVALLKVQPPTPLVAVSFADSDQVRPGQAVVVIGKLIGLESSVSFGVISAINTNRTEPPYEFLQTDAAINEGSGGSPLFTLDGEVVGMAYSAPTEKGHIGVAFAIPAKLISGVVPKLEQFGAVERGWLGIHVGAVTDDLARSAGLGEPRGVQITKVMPDSPAAAAGLVAGDIVLQLNSAKITQSVDVVRNVAEMPPNTNVDVMIWRGKGEQTLRATLGKWALNMVASASSAPAATPSATTEAKAAAAKTTIEKQGSGAPPDASTDGVYWQSVKDSGSVAELQSYLTKFPNGQFAELARIRVEKLGAAQPPRIDRVDVLKVGIYSAGPAKVIKDPSMSTGQREEGEFTNVKATTTIPAKDDTWFGLDAAIVGAPTGANVPITIVWRYPQPGLKNPNGGAPTLSDTYVDNSPSIGKSSHFGWHIADHRALALGTWTVELWYGNRNLLSQSFTLVPAR